jgi:hypothetical protein
MPRNSEYPRVRRAKNRINIEIRKHNPSERDIFTRDPSTLTSTPVKVWRNSEGNILEIEIRDITKVTGQKVAESIGMERPEFGPIMRRIQESISDDEWKKLKKVDEE